MEVKTSYQCTIEDVQPINKGRFYELYLDAAQYLDEETGEYLEYNWHWPSNVCVLNLAELMLIKDLSNNQYYLAHRVYKNNRKEKQLINDFVIAKDQSKSWHEISQMQINISLICSYELVDIDEVIDSIATLSPDQIGERQLFIAQFYSSCCITKTDNEYTLESDGSLAMFWYKEAAKNGSDVAKCRIGVKLCIDGKFDDIKEALNIFSKLAHNGYGKAYHWQGLCLYHWKKWEGAKTCFIKAVQMGVDVAICPLARGVIDGIWDETDIIMSLDNCENPYRLMEAGRYYVLSGDTNERYEDYIEDYWNYDHSGEYYIEDNCSYYDGEWHFEPYDHDDYYTPSLSGCGIGYSCDNCPNIGCHANTENY